MAKKKRTGTGPPGGPGAMAALKRAQAKLKEMGIRLYKHVPEEEKKAAKAAKAEAAKPAEVPAPPRAAKAPAKKAAKAPAKNAKASKAPAKNAKPATKKRAR